MQKTELVISFELFASIMILFVVFFVALIYVINANNKH